MYKILLKLFLCTENAKQHLIRTVKKTTHQRNAETATFKKKDMKKTSTDYVNWKSAVTLLPSQVISP
jgi:hypothetical protein